MNLATEAALIDPPETSPDVVVFYRSVLDFWPLVILFFLTCALAVALTLQFPWSLEVITIGTVLGYEISVGLPLFGLIPVLVLARIAHGVVDPRYVLADRYILEVEGTLSLSKRSNRIHYWHIRSVEIDQRVWQRIVNTGDVILSASGMAGSDDLHLRGVYRPRAVKELIEQRIQHTPAPSKDHLE